MTSNRFYLICLRDTVGSNVAFHRKNGYGYTTDIDQAEVFTREQAQRRWNTGRDIDLPVCADQVDALSVEHVDFQQIPSHTEMLPNCDQYVAYRTGKWDGNDVYWLTAEGRSTTDFSMAAVFETPYEDIDLVWLPLDKAASVKRRTISMDRINRRKMIQAQGLVTPDHIKRVRRKKPSTGKTRWNCPGCGRIHWQGNPYDFEGCKHPDCDQWRISA